MAARRQIEKPRLFEPWAPPPDTTLPEIAAIKAVFAGTATPEQQRAAMHFILVRVCRVDDEPFCPGEDGRRSTDYALGMRRVATYLRSLHFADLRNFQTDAAPREQP